MHSEAVLLMTSGSYQRQRVEIGETALPLALEAQDAAARKGLEGGNIWLQSADGQMQTLIDGQ